MNEANDDGWVGDNYERQFINRYITVINSIFLDWRKSRLCFKIIAVTFNYTGLLIRKHNFHRLATACNEDYHPSCSSETEADGNKWRNYWCGTTHAQSLERETGEN